MDKMEKMVKEDKLVNKELEVPLDQGYLIELIFKKHNLLRFFCLF